ncbi:MAG: FAD-binding oxidoreductase [Armatimonadota bacterium]
MNIANILHERIASGDIGIDVRKSRGWSAWHHHQISPQDVTIVTPRDKGAFLWAIQRCRDESIPYELVGGGTSTAKPSGVGVQVETRCLDTLIIDETAQELIVGAGVAIDAAEAFVAEKGWTLGQWIGSGATATIGGSIVTNAMGILTGRYGTLEDAISAAEIVDSSGEPLWVTAAGLANSTSPTILSVRLPLWLCPDGRAVARFDGADDAFAAIRHIATARLVPAHISVDHSGAITVIVEGETHLETARYQLIAAILQKHGAVQDQTLDQNRHWDRLMSSNPWTVNAGGKCWTDRIRVHTPWSDCANVLDTWAQRAVQAGAELTWFALNPTVSGMCFVFDVTIPGTTIEPEWLFAERP